MNTDAFWEFMIERELIRRKRLSGFPMDKWTDDSIFKTYSFTNVKREHDRTTALLNKEYYAQHALQHPSSAALLNAALFRYHGTVATACDLGWHSEWDNHTKNRVIKKNFIRLSLGERVFTSAYIVPNCGDPRPKHEVVADIIDGIWNSKDQILEMDSWETATAIMKCNWGVGSFMAKEVLLDYILATGWKPLDWETWTPVGPGARRGAGAIVNGVIKGISEYEALLVCRMIYAERDKVWPEGWVDLDLTDIQFQLCEFAKYEKARTGIGRPKKRFRPTIDEVTRHG